jgi:hypothetical protein
MGHHPTQINTSSPRMSKAAIVETQKQPTKIKVTQSFNVVITTIGVEMVIMPNMNVVKKGLVIEFVTNLGRGLGGVSTRKNLNRSSRLPASNTKVVGTPHMVFTNPIMTIHVNKTVDQLLMSSIAIGRYRSTDAKNLRGGYQEPSIKTQGIFYHRNGHSIRPNRVILKHLNFLKNVNLDAHVRVFNSIVKANAETFEEYIINAFSYMLKDTT